MSYLSDFLLATASPVLPNLTPLTGKDLSCATQVDARCSTIDPTSAKAGAQALLRRLQTRRGSLIDEPGYGYDILGALNRGMTAIEISQIESSIQAEAQEIGTIERVSITTISTAESVRVNMTVFGRRFADIVQFRIVSTGTDVEFQEIT